MRRYEVVIYMAKKHGKLKRKKAKRMFLVTLICISINVYILYSVGVIFSDVYKMNDEKKTLTAQLNDLKEEEDILKSEVNKLKDPVYIAKYAREKFLYSGKGEYIIRMK